MVAASDPLRYPRKKNVFELLLGDGRMEEAESAAERISSPLLDLIFGSPTLYLVLLACWLVAVIIVQVYDPLPEWLKGIPDNFWKLLFFLVTALLSLNFAMHVEKKRRPKIEMSPAIQLGNDVGGRPMTTIRVKVMNEDPKRWYGRLPALRCFGRITVYEYDCIRESYRQVGKTFARWAALAQPMPLFGYDALNYPVKSLRLPIEIFDTNRYDPLDQEPVQKKDIHPGLSADLDLACRFIDEKTCLIWTNQFYQPSFLPIRPDIIRLNPGTYLIRIKISSSSTGDFRSTFLLFNRPGQFRLEGPIPVPDVVLRREREKEQKEEELRHAFQQKDTSQLTGLLADKTYREINLGSSWTPLMVLSFRGDWQLVNLLLDYREDVNAKEDAGWTALLFAVAEGHLAVTRLLLNRGANPNVRARNGLGPLDLARQNGDSDMEKLLLNKGAVP